jgi:hypothetical protein
MFTPAVWHLVDFEEDVDTEFPKVERPTFNPLPPSAYRLAEPGDTLDRIIIYVAAASVVLASVGLVRNRGGAHWPAALALGLAALWYSATPGPTVDGWHGLGWRTIADARSEPQLRAALFLAALALASIVVVSLLRSRPRLRADWSDARARGTGGLLIAALVLVIARQFELPGIEPVGYWPRSFMILGLIAFDLVLLIEVARGSRPAARNLFIIPAALACWWGLVLAGIVITWYHRPLARLKVVEPGRIYISAMPTPRGLEVANNRQHFRTIINLFGEDSPQRSPLLDDELRFAKEHGIRYLGSPTDPSEAASNAFLDRTLALAQDPSAWPILVHCHGCMDRSPAWMGIYRFVIQKRPLLEVMQEIERHRGYRPKASVTLLYNRALPPRAGARYWTDPTALLLRRCAGESVDPKLASRDERVATANPSGESGVSRGAAPVSRPAH